MVSSVFSGGFIKQQRQIGQASLFLLHLAFIQILFFNLKILCRIVNKLFKSNSIRKVVLRFLCH